MMGTAIHRTSRLRPRWCAVLLGGAMFALGIPTEAQPPPPAQPAPTQPPPAVPPYQPAPPGTYPATQPPPPPGYSAYGYPPTYGPPYGYYGPSGPKTIPYREGQPAPPGYYLDTRSSRGLVIGGAITFGLGYFFALISAPIVAAVREADGKDDNAATALVLPVVGPFIAIYTLDADGTGTSFLILDGLMQAGGAAMLIAGLAAKKKVWVRGDIGGVEFEVAPTMVGKRGMGLGMHGAF